MQLVGLQGLLGIVEVVRVPVVGDEIEHAGKTYRVMRVVLRTVHKAGNVPAADVHVI